MKNKITIYVLQGAGYSEDGDLTPYSQVYTTFEEAKKALHDDYISSSRFDEGTEDEWIDEDAWIAEDGKRWGSSGPNQTYCEIVKHEIELAN